MQVALLVLAIVSIGECSLCQETLAISSGDLLHIQIADTPEMEQHARVTDDGFVPVRGIGQVKVMGLTPGAAADVVRNRLIAEHYLNHPEISITVDEYATKQVSIIGEVKTSGAYGIKTPRPVLEVLALAGGLTSEADRHIVIQRQGNPQKPISYYVSNNAREAISSQVFVNPGDTVVVPRAGIVYVLGDVNRPGGYVMSNNESQLTLLQALALAGGVARTAKENRARLIRHAGDTYQDTQLSLNDIQKGKKPDMALAPADVLYVPFSFARNLASSGAANIVGAAASASIYAIP
jgi:polysaccharide export outer membrane protein